MHRCPDDEGNGRQARRADVDTHIPVDIDANILSTEHLHSNKLDLSGCPEALLCTNHSSHIHLAASKRDYKAWEEQGRGVFTAALLKGIRVNGADKVTYQSLMTSLPNSPG